MPDTSTIAPALALLPITPSERSALRVLLRAGAVTLADAKPTSDLTCATVTALEALQKKGLVDWRRLEDVRVYWLTSDGERRANAEATLDALSAVKRKKVA